MPSIKFDDRTLKGLAVPEGKEREEWADILLPGFRFRLTRTGAASFSVVYRVKGRKKQERLTLGLFPRLALGKARAIAREVLNKAALGEDPKEELEPALTFGALVSAYLEKHASRKLLSWRDIASGLKKDALPVLGKLAAKDVKQRHLALVVDRCEQRGALSSADRSISNISAVYNWAIGRGLVETNPAYRIPKLHRIQPGTRWLRDEEILAVWRALEEIIAIEPIRQKGRPGADRQAALAVMARLILGQRTREILLMGWEQLADGWWNIPAANTKTGRPHRVPLPRLFEERVLLKAREIGGGSRWVFASPYREGALPIVPNVVANFVGALTARLTLNGEPVVFVARDLRRTFVTHLARLKVPKETRQRLVNHVTGSVIDAHYDRYDYDAETRAAMDVWEAHLRSVLFGGAPAALLPFRR